MRSRPRRMAPRFIFGTDNQTQTPSLSPSLSLPLSLSLSLSRDCRALALTLEKRILPGLKVMKKQIAPRTRKKLFPPAIILDLRCKTASDAYNINASRAIAPASRAPSVCSCCPPRRPANRARPPHPAAPRLGSYSHSPPLAAKPRQRGKRAACTAMHTASGAHGPPPCRARRGARGSC